MESSQIDEFSEYLSSVGFYPTNPNIKSQHYQKVKFPSQKIQLMQSEIFSNYLNSLDSDQKKILSIRMINKFYENKHKKKITKLHSILAFLDSKNKLSKELTKQKYFYKWIMELNKLKVEEEEKQILNNNNRCMDNTNDNSKNIQMKTNPKVSRTLTQSPKNKNNSLKISSASGVPTNVNTEVNTASPIEKHKSCHCCQRLETSIEKKEKKELEECTFHPKTNRSSYRKDTNNKPVYERLIASKEKTQLRIDLKRKAIDDMDSLNSSFSPKINKYKVFKPKTGRQSEDLYNYCNTETNDSNYLQDFSSRQRNFLRNKEEHKKRISDEYNTKDSSLCPFKPKFYKNKKYSSNSFVNAPFKVRLEEDEKSRRNKTLEYLQNNSQNQSKEKRNVDYKWLNDLYQRYKNKSSLVQEIKEKMEEEEGLTFNPHLNKKDKYFNKINTNVTQRSEVFLEHKKNFIYDFKKCEEEVLKLWREKKDSKAKNIYDYREQKNFSKEKDFEKNKPKYRKNQKKSKEKKETITSRVELSDSPEERNNFKERNHTEGGNNYGDKIMSFDEYNSGKNKKETQCFSGDLYNYNSEGDMRGLHSNKNGSKSNDIFDEINP
ncbi:MAG: hypothetical protein MJ252_11055 [archaeon]|nr:hypothetical protein [archaeon]